MEGAEGGGEVAVGRGSHQIASQAYRQADLLRHASVALQSRTHMHVCVCVYTHAPLPHPLRRFYEHEH